MATATEVIAGAFGKVAIFQPGDAIPPADSEAALTRLNSYLNSLNAKGAVFENVDLDLGDDVPVADQNLDDLEWAFAAEIADQWGKVLTPRQEAKATMASNRFIAANIVVYPATLDGGLGRMPSTRRWWTGF